MFSCLNKAYASLCWPLETCGGCGGLYSRYNHTTQHPRVSLQVATSSLPHVRRVRRRRRRRCWCWGWGWGWGGFTPQRYRAVPGMLPQVVGPFGSLAGPRVVLHGCGESTGIGSHKWVRLSSTCKHPTTNAQPHLVSSQNVFLQQHKQRGRVRCVRNLAARCLGTCLAKFRRPGCGCVLSRLPPWRHR